MVLFLQGSCVGQGSFSDLSNIDVQSLVSIPDSAYDSAVETDDVEKKEKEKDATRSIETTTTVQPVVRGLSFCYTF